MIAVGLVLILVLPADTKPFAGPQSLSKVFGQMPRNIKPTLSQINIRHLGQNEQGYLVVEPEFFKDILPHEVTHSAP
jgi:hypothetical protein